MVTESAWGDLAPNVRDALEAIHGGATADSQESLILEFKEDPAVREGEKGARAKLVEKLLNEAICMANSEAATGHIVVGWRIKPRARPRSPVRRWTRKSSLRRYSTARSQT